tara:strand:+ start:1916 stop:2107 length:192 start_codon:yes stop_codon:yes gene_type:complete
MGGFRWDRMSYGHHGMGWEVLDGMGKVMGWDAKYLILNDFIINLTKNESSIKWVTQTKRRINL